MEIRSSLIRPTFPFGLNEERTALYVHIPFCSKRCPYCAFYKLIWDAESESRFLNGIDNEIKAYGDQFGKIPLRSVFWGGGTPTTLTLEGTHRLATMLRHGFQIDPDIEWTIEANPEGVSEERLRHYAAIGINRISIGVQSILPNELRVLGRDHTRDAIGHLKSLIQSVGFRSINLDFIFGLPGQSISEFNHSLEWALDWEPTHFSTYALSIEPGTVYAKTGVQAADDDVMLAMMRRIREQAISAGYHHYETSAFCKPGYESQHNLAYWHYSPYIGLGPSAASFFHGMAYTQVSSLDRYVQDSTPPVIKAYKKIDDQTLLANYLIANLRRMDGVTTEQISRDLGRNPWPADHPKLIEFKSAGFLCADDTRLQLTNRGLEVMNSLLEELL